MLLSRLAALITVAVVSMTATACSGSSSGSSGSSTGSSTSSSTSSSAVPRSRSGASEESTSTSPSSVKGGTALADTGHLIYVLEAVNPRIGTNKADLVAKSKALCTHINANEPAGTLVAHAAKGFTNGSWVPSAAEAQAIVGTVKAYGGC